MPVIGSAGLTGWHDEALAKGPGVSIGRSGASIGKVTYTATDYWPHNACLYVTDFLGNSPRFIYYFLQTRDFTSLNSGAAQPSLNRNFVHTVPVRVPGPESQCRIAEALSLYDDLIENNRKRIALLEQAARLLYREWFVHLRFPGHEHVAKSAGVPAGWERLPSSVAFHINPSTPRVDDGELTYAPMASLSETGMVIDKTPFESRRESTSVRYKVGDTLFARITPCLENGKTGFVQFLAPDEVACGSTEFIVLRGSRVSNYYVYLTARQPSFRENAIKSMIGSSGRQRVQPSCFDRYFVLVPPSNLAALFDEAVAPLFDQVRVLDQQNQSLAQARDLLLPRLMNGEVVV